MSGKKINDDDDILLKCAFQKYNYYKKYLYRWSNYKASWILSQGIPKEKREINGIIIEDYYGVFVFNIYKSLIGL